MPTFSVSIPQELWNRLEYVRGDVSRSRTVKNALEAYLWPTGSGPIASSGLRTVTRPSDKTTPAKGLTPGKPYKLPKIAPRKQPG
jgi:predicted DNA-binding protein